MVKCKNCEHKILKDIGKYAGNYIHYSNDFSLVGMGKQKECFVYGCGCTNPELKEVD